MSIYYKATSRDGTSFRDGRTRWGAGSVVRIPEGERGKALCHSGILHASTEPGEALAGGRWPCRLFIVVPVGQLFTESAFRYKAGAWEWQVTQEIEAWQALGPNGREIAALIKRCAHLEAKQAKALDAAWNAAWNAAWSAARAAAWDAAWDAALDAARAAAWNAAGAAAWCAAGDAAGDAAGNAATALCVKDLISERLFDILYGPWASVMEAEG